MFMHWAETNREYNFFLWTALRFWSKWYRCVPLCLQYLQESIRILQMQNIYAYAKLLRHCTSRSLVDYHLYCHYFKQYNLYLPSLKYYTNFNIIPPNENHFHTLAHLLTSHDVNKNSSYHSPAQFVVSYFTVLSLWHTTDRHWCRKSFPLCRNIIITLLG